VVARTFGAAVRACGSQSARAALLPPFARRAASSPAISRSSHRTASKHRASPTFGDTRPAGESGISDATPSRWVRHIRGCVFRRGPARPITLQAERKSVHQVALCRRSDRRLMARSAVIEPASPRSRARARRVPCVQPPPTVSSLPVSTRSSSESESVRAVSLD